MDYLQRYLFLITIIIIFIVALVAGQIFIPTAANKEIKNIALQHIPKSAQPKTHIDVTMPIPALLAIFGRVRAVKIETPVLKLSEKTKVFKLLNKSKNVDLKIKRLITDYIPLHDVKLISHQKNFTFTGTIKRSDLENSYGGILEFKHEAKGDRIAVIISDSTTPGVLRFVSAGNGTKILAYVEVNGEIMLDKKFTVISDPDMRAKKIQVKTRGNNFVIKITGNTR